MLIDDLAQAIARQEGFGKPGRATRNNNPGNIWDGMGRRIWPHLPTDDRGFIVYDTPEDGWKALRRDLSLKIKRGMTLRQIIYMWAPPKENDSARYLANVAAWTKLPTDQPLKAIA